jgi:hypothetical protein
MGTLAWIIAGATLGLASPFMVLQLQRRRDAARAGASGRVNRAEAVRPGNPFAAVSIRPCAESPCAAVVQMHHQRYLALRAPALPVAGCDRKTCGCRYIRHADRRSTGDRRDSLARWGGLTPKMGKERRASSDDRRGTPAR